MAYNAISDEIKKFTPDEGFNLVGIDSHGMPGESLYLIKHFDTLADAQTEQAKHKGENTVIYPN